MRTVAFLFLLAVVVLFGVIVAIEHQPQRLPLVKANMPTGNTARSNELFAPCPLAPRNLPTPQKEDA